MEEQLPSALSRFRPAVPRHYLFGLSGVFWSLAGVVLCVRATRWLVAFPLGVEIALETGSIAIALVGYLLLFVRIVRKNIDRISHLPEKACVFAFTAWYGYLLIALMMTLGIMFRNAAIPNYYLAVPYTAMGAILLIGSARFYKQFLTAIRRRQD
jgi:hypothetical protein